jgi:hypothetical protein
MKILIVVQCFVVSLLSEQIFNIFGKDEPEDIDTTLGTLRKRKSKTFLDLIFEDWLHLLDE